jgi:hypothetical protein
VSDAGHESPAADDPDDLGQALLERRDSWRARGHPRDYLVPVDRVLLPDDGSTTWDAQGVAQRLMKALPCTSMHVKPVPGQDGYAWMADVYDKSGTYLQPVWRGPSEASIALEIAQGLLDDWEGSAKGLIDAAETLDVSSPRAVAAHEPSTSGPGA